MIPGNVDPRRPDKVQRYKAPVNSNGQGEDLTPDYMNILGHQATTANAADASESTTTTSTPGGGSNMEDQDNTTTSSNATNVIPTSPQYGVAIIANNVTTSATDTPSDTVTAATDIVVDTTAKIMGEENKDLQSTPSRNDRFKVVKIASLEPFKRGRWKCMDYVDEVPPQTNQPSKVTPSTGNMQTIGGVYLQTQSLPQQQIQQILMQGGYTNGSQFFQSVPAQIIPQTQFYYPPGATVPQPNLPQQIVNSSGVPSSMPTQFINQQPYFAGGVVQNAAGFTVPQNFPNVQYVPANLIQNQNSAFVPTSQTVQLPANFQQSQTYAGPPNQTQPIVNGHAFAQQLSEQVSNSLPTQSSKSVFLNSTVPQSATTQGQMTPQGASLSQSAHVMHNAPYQQNQFQQVQQPQQQPVMQQQQAQSNVIQVSQVVSVPSQTLDQNVASNVYTNPQFAMSVNSLTVLENNEPSTDNIGDAGSAAVASAENSDDPAKTNPVVNAIDNKIEQAMDLVKSHLMYTVREEVEVLKEKIAELMEKIQQLETENNYLRTQIPKNQPLNIPVACSVPTTNVSISTTTTQNSVLTPAMSQNPPATVNQSTSTEQHPQ